MTENGLNFYRSSRLHTPLCDLLGIRYPIIQAPMAGGFTTPELVAAVTNAGGLGMLAGMGVPPERLRELMRAIRGLTSGPFGVNFLIPAPSEEGNRDVVTTQRFLDHFREELALAAWPFRRGPTARRARLNSWKWSLTRGCRSSASRSAIPATSSSGRTAPDPEWWQR